MRRSVVTPPVDRELLAYLTGRPQPGPWRGWDVKTVSGGRNNLLYRATGPHADLVVKFTLRDSRDRAGREFAALRALWEAGIPIAPRPLLLDSQSYELPVVVQEWLAGSPLEAPPRDDAGWERIAELLERCYSVTPECTGVELPPAVLSPRTFDDALGYVRRELALLPAEERPPVVEAAARRLAAMDFHAWPEPPVALCHCDPNTSNLLARPGLWAAVDWENAGWGDPAFDIADLTRHAAYRSVGEERWQWVIGRLCGSDAGVRRRVLAYRSVLAVQWAARLARVLYEWPRGLDGRLAAREPGWEGLMRGNYDHYLALISAECLTGGDPWRE